MRRGVLTRGVESLVPTNKHAERRAIARIRPRRSSIYRKTPQARAGSGRTARQYTQADATGSWIRPKPWGGGEQVHHSLGSPYHRPASSVLTASSVRPGQG